MKRGRTGHNPRKPGLQAPENHCLCSIFRLKTNTLSLVLWSFSLIARRLRFAQTPMHGYALNLMSVDRPGIVAAVSQAVELLGGNIFSCSQTVLDGYFTLIMLIGLPEEWDSADLAEKIRGAQDLGPRCMVSALPIPTRPQNGENGQNAANQKNTEPGTPESEIYIITIFGRDRLGIIRQFTGYLAGRDINIADLFGRRIDEDFQLIGQLEVPPELDIRLIQDDLEEMGRELGFTVRLQHNNLFTATNHLRFH